MNKPTKDNRDKSKINFQLPPAVFDIIHTIEAHGHEAYAVGGCVRDSILGKVPNDWDITTSASPKEIKSIFNKTFDTGIEHGTVTVRMRGESYEVTTYRIDGEYVDARHPKEVAFTNNLKEDLMRRDFTINAMAYHPTRGLVDAFGGIRDMECGIIRAVGRPDDRFTEDALRMLRAIRFSAQLGFDIEEETYGAICRLSGNIERISWERIRMEVEKLLVSDHPERMRDIYETGLSKVFMPEWDALFATEQNSVHHVYDVGEHTIAVLKGLPNEHVLRLAGLLHDIGKPVTRKTDEKGRDHFVGHPQVGARMAKDILRRLKFDNDTIGAVCALVKYHDERPEPTLRNARRLMARVGDGRMDMLFCLNEADIGGQSDYMREEKLERVARMRTLVAEIRRKNEAVTIAGLAINGRDLANVGVPKGRMMGEILRELLKEVVDEPAMNERERLLGRAKEICEKAKGNP